MPHGRSDGDAIATDKVALLPGETATFANYTSYARGINGLIVDVGGLADPQTLDAADFTFKVGNDNDPGRWADAPAPTSVTVRPGEGESGSDRVTITWADGAIANEWLQVTVLANGRTGLAEDDVFYFGNAVGETGNFPGYAMVNAADERAVRDNQRGPAHPGRKGPVDPRDDLHGA